MRLLPVLLPLGVATLAGIWLAIELLFHRYSRVDLTELTFDEWLDRHDFVDGD